MGKIKDRLGWVPNLFTLSNLTLGFFATLISGRSGGNVEYLQIAGGMILLAMMCDGLDGFMARLLGAESGLGAQLDSLADLTTFGIAPGTLMYALLLHALNFEVGPSLWLPTGALIAAIFPACAAYRLARFNVSHDTDGFSGLPSPVAGIMVGLIPVAFGDWVPGHELELPGILLTLIFMLVAFLMVSTVRYPKPQVKMFRHFSRGRLSVVLIFMLVALVIVAIYRGMGYAAVGIFSLICIYIVIGLISLTIHTIQRLRL